MGQMFQKRRYFLASILVYSLLAGCEKIENTPPTQNDSLAVIPVPPAVDSATIPDTAAVDSTASSGAARP